MCIMCILIIHSCVSRHKWISNPAEAPKLNNLKNIQQVDLWQERTNSGRTVLLWAAGCCNALKCVASKFRYINIYVNRYVNKNRCVYKDKCTWDVGECMKANFNYLYEQNKDISTGAVADGEKGNTTVDRATCVCIRCSIVFR